MLMIPTQILSLWGTGLLSVGIIAAGVYLARRWYEEGWVYDEVLKRDVFHADLGWNQHTAILAGFVALLIWATLGRLVARGLGALIGKLGSAPKAKAGDDPTHDRFGEVRTLNRPGGAVLHVEMYGAADAPPIVLTHGWGCDATEWNDLKRALGDRYRLIAWDLPGLGKSKMPEDRDYRLETFAAHLDAVLDLAGGRPAILMGHSIGGMTTLTYCKRYPQNLGAKVAGLALVHTTYTNPVRTTSMAGLYTAIEKPVLVPILWLTIGLYPLVWAMNWLSYFNGTTYNQAKSSGYAGTQTPAQVEWSAEFSPKANPAVMARGMFGMLGYDASTILSKINIPTLIVPGDRDPVCKPEASEHMARTIPGATLRPLSPAKHMGLIEHHAALASLVGEFAATIPALGRTPAGALDPARPRA